MIFPLTINIPSSSLSHSFALKSPAHIYSQLINYNLVIQSSIYQSIKVKAKDTSELKPLLSNTHLQLSPLLAQTAHRNHKHRQSLAHYESYFREPLDFYTHYQPFPHHYFFY